MQSSKTSDGDPGASGLGPAMPLRPHYPQQQFNPPLSSQYSGGAIMPVAVTPSASTGMAYTGMPPQSHAAGALFKDSTGYMAASYAGIGAMSGLSVGRYFDSGSGSDYAPSSNPSRPHADYQPISSFRALNSPPEPGACPQVASASANTSNGILPSNGGALTLTSSTSPLNTNDANAAASGAVYSSQLTSIYKPPYSTQCIPAADQNLVPSVATNSALTTVPYCLTHFSPHTGANLTYYSGGAPPVASLRQYPFLGSSRADAFNTASAVRLQRLDNGQYVMLPTNTVTPPEYAMLPPGNFASSMAGYTSYAGGPQAGELIGSSSLVPPLLTQTTFNEHSNALPPLASPFGAHELHVDAVAANKICKSASASGPRARIDVDVVEGELATAATVAPAPLTYSSTSNSDPLDSLAEDGDQQSQAGGKQLKRGPESIAADEADLPPEVRAEREKHRRQANNFRER